MSRRFILAMVAAIGLAGMGAVVASTPAHAEWEGHNWHPWYGYTWQPYWRPYVYSTPYSYGYRDDGYAEVCHWEKYKERWTDEKGRSHTTWKRERVCD